MKEKQPNVKLRFARLQAQLSQEQLAELLSPTCSTSTISRWECGRSSPAPYYCQQLVDILGMPRQELGLSFPNTEPSSLRDPWASTRTWLHFLYGRKIMEGRHSKRRR